MAVIRVSLQNPSRVTSSVVTDSSRLIVSRSIYQKLGSLVGNRTISEDYANGNLSPEYVELLDELDKILTNNSFPNLPPLDTDPAVEEMNVYLGELGIDIEYHYSKDHVDIPAWLDKGDQTEYRYLTDLADDTVLIDESDNTVLVHYTGDNNG